MCCFEAIDKKAKISKLSTSIGVSIPVSQKVCLGAARNGSTSGPDLGIRTTRLVPSRD